MGLRFSFALFQKVGFGKVAVGGNDKGFNLTVGEVERIGLAEKGEVGCKTVLDIAPADLSEMSGEELRAKIL